MSDRWILRSGSKRGGFRYRDPRGRPVRDERVLARIDALRIPPAWRDVHIAASPRAMLQAWGIDARGRKQYRYHERAVETRELRKYYRVRQLARELPRVRAALYHDLAHAGCGEVFQVALDQAPAADVQQRFRHVVGQRPHAQAAAGREDHRAPDRHAEASSRGRVRSRPARARSSSAANAASSG